MNNGKEIEKIKKELAEEIKIFKEKNPKGIVIITGSTASGKTKLSILLADILPIEIISADSRQIYKYMDIGTDKVPIEYRKKTPHYQIDIIHPNEIYTTAQWQQESYKIILKILEKNKIPFIVGGTGLYIDSIYKNFQIPHIEPDWKLRKQLEEKENQNPGYLYNQLLKIDPKEAKKLNPGSTRFLIRALEIFFKTGKKKSELVKSLPPKWPIFLIVLQSDKEKVNQAIEKRVYEMLQNGLIEEVETLLKMGFDKNLPAMQGIGYKEVIDFLEGKINKQEMIEKIIQNTIHFAKRQRTWFRRYQKDQEKNPQKNVIYKFIKI